MNEVVTAGPEIINSDDVLAFGSVTDVETIKVKWSIILAALSLAIATAALFWSMYSRQTDVQTWATGLISAIAGAAISYGFNARSPS